MINLRKLLVILSKLPSGLLTAVCLAAILWLTLAPDPMGNFHPPMFAGADKLIHAIMFGGLALCIETDMWRDGKFAAVGYKSVLIAAVCSLLTGALIEYLQYIMHLGRAFEWYDILADGIGAFLFAILTRRVLNLV